MFHASRFVPVLSALTVLAAACDEEDLDLDTDQDIELRCANCTFNSPRGNDYDVPELNYHGVPNDDGMRLMGFLDPNDYFRTLVVVNDALEAHDEQGQFVAGGQNLVGWRIWLRDASDEDRIIHIFGFQPEVAQLVNPTFSSPVYAMAYEDPDVPGRFKNICPDTLNDPFAKEVTVIGGETYPRNASKVISNPDWFTLACRKEAVFKMKFLGYSPNRALGNGPNPATVEQRLATLRMLRGDYCGDGESYTLQDTPIALYNVGGSVGSHVAAFPYEAIWSWKGALCLSQQRVATIKVPCAWSLPKCEGYQPPAGAGVEWTTQIPTP